MIRRFAGFPILLIALVVAISACQKMVEKERMEAAAAYSKAVCACVDKPSDEAKACAAAVQEPKDPVGETGIGTQPKYKLESLHQYDDVIGVGNQCKRTIMMMQ